MTLLSVETLGARHGLLQAVREMSFEVAEGETLALVGPNGAGKTTLLRTIAGAHRPSEGRVFFEGKDVTKLPAFERVLSELTPLLGNVTPPLRNFEPFLKFTGEYVPELQALFANASAASQAHDKNNDVANFQIQHYLRALNTIGPEGLAVYNQRIGTNRANPYFKPGGLRLLGSGGLQVFSTGNCADSAPSLSVPAKEQTPLEKQLVEDHVVNEAGSTTNSVGAPACTQQAPFTWEGVTSQFPRVTRAK